MHDSLPALLARTRLRLNATIALHRALAWAAPAAVAAGLLAAAARALGLEASGFVAWVALSLLGAAAGALSARASFLDEAAAARWLDERLGDGELLAAAFWCIGRGAEGRFDSALIAEAGELLPRARELRVSPRPLAKRAIRALAALGIGAYLVFLSGTAIAPQAGSVARGRGEAERGKADKAIAAAAALEGNGKAAADFAAALFPKDRRMATLTERALREGRIDDLRELLKSAGLDIDAKLSGGMAESERKKLVAERERIGEAVASLAFAAQARSDREGGSSREGPSPGGNDARGGPPPGAYPFPYSGMEGSGGGSASGTRPGKGSPPGSGGSGSGESGLEGSGEAGEGPAGKGGNSYGTGSGSEGAWGDIDPRKGPGVLELAPPRNPNFFELLLPGSEASEPVSSLVPSSRRSAEAAMTREDLPLEYEDSVRSYYLQLSKGENR